MFEKPALWASPLGGGPVVTGREETPGILNAYSLHCYRCGSCCLVVLLALPLRPFQIQCLKGVCRICRSSNGFSSWLTFKGELFLLGLQGGRYLINNDDRL